MKPIHDVNDKVYFYMASSGVLSGTIDEMRRSADNPHTWECSVKYTDKQHDGTEFDTCSRMNEEELYKTVDDLKEATLKKITDRFEAEKKSLIEDIEMYNE